MEKLTKEEEIIELLEKIYDFEVDYHKKLHEYFNDFIDKEGLLSDEYRFHEIADMCCDLHSACNALSLMRELSTKINQRNETEENEVELPWECSKHFE